MANYIKSYSVTVDAVNQPRNSDTSTIVYNQGDLNEDQLSLTLTFNNLTVDLTTATAVEIYFLPQSGSVTKQDLTNGITFTNRSQGQLLLTLNSQTTANPGTISAEVHVTFPGNQIIVFKKFTFTIEGALSSSTQSQNSYQTLVPLQVVSSVANLPTASVTYRGATFFVQGASGSADASYMCKKLSDDTYDWVQYA